MNRAPAEEYCITDTCRSHRCGIMVSILHCGLTVVEWATKEDFQIAKSFVHAGMLQKEM